MHELVSLIKKYKLKPASQRSLSFLTHTIVNLGYTVILRKKIGISYGAIGVMGKRDYFHTMYNEDTIAEQTKRYLKKNKKRLHKILLSWKKEFNLLRSDIYSLDKDKQIELKSKLDRILDIYVQYLGILGAYNCFWRYLGNREKDEFLSNKDIVGISKQRDIVARLYPKIEILIKRYTDSIGKREGFDGDFLKYFSFDEIKDYIKKDNLNKKKLQDLERRRKGYFRILIEKGNKSVITTDKKVIDDIKKRFFDINKDLKQIKGFPSYKGMVKGAVFNLQKDKKVPKKEFVLVVGNTHPNQIAIIKKSVAIVTDEGGILSHAAVISRELKIPCIISTKIATKVFKSGDYVEVDANRGVVKKLR